MAQAVAHPKRKSSNRRLPPKPAAPEPIYAAIDKHLALDAPLEAAMEAHSAAERAGKVPLAVERRWAKAAVKFNRMLFDIAEMRTSDPEAFAAKILYAAARRDIEGGTNWRDDEALFAGIANTVAAIVPRPYSEPYKRVLAIVAKLNAEAKAYWKRNRARKAARLKQRRVPVVGTINAANGQVTFHRPLPGAGLSV